MIISKTLIRKDILTTANYIWIKKDQENIFVSYLSDLLKWNNDINTNVNVSVNGNDESVSYENEERESHQAFPQIQIQNFWGIN